MAVKRDTICYMCTNCCPIVVYIFEGKIVGVEPKEKRLACPRWRALPEFIYHKDRLRYPLKRKGRRGEGQFEPISWDEALDLICQSLNRIKSQYGPEAFAIWVSYTKEPRAYFQRFIHAFGSPNYCTESSSCASSAMLAAYLTFGTRGGFIPQIKDFPKLRLVWGSSIKNSRPQQWYSFVDYKKKGGKLIVVDPRLTDLAEMADIHLQLRPGTDGALALSMINVIIKENLIDKAFIKEWTKGFEELERLAENYTPQYTEKITGVSASLIREAAVLYALEKPSRVILSPNSTTHHTNGLQNHRAILLLPVITGNIDPFLPQPGKPKINDISLFDRVKEMREGVGSKRFPLWTSFWREMQSNVLVEQIESEKPYPIKALFGAGLDIQFFPNSNRFKEILNKLDFIVVSEYFHTPSTYMADIVLPIASFLERTGLYINEFADRIILVEPVIEPLGECWPEWKILSEIAKRLDFGELFFNGDFRKYVDYILEPAGINYDYLKGFPEGIPIPREEPEKGFNTPSGKIEIFSSILMDYGFDPVPSYREPEESPLTRKDLAAKYPLVLTSGARVPFYIHSQFRNLESLRRHMPEPLIDIHPHDAKQRGIRSGDWVIVISPRGSIKMKANVTERILKGVVSLPHGWPGDMNVNVLVDDKTLDPITGFPPFKSQLCEVIKEGPSSGDREGL